jgi:phenylalanyl-tRNA synthetase beta chain
MRLVVSWLREFVDVTASADAIADTLGLRGFEVAGIERLAGGDAVIDFEITANRPDCLSVIGLAREASTAFDVPLRPAGADPDSPTRMTALPVGSSEALKIRIEDEELCPRYAAAVARVHIQPSPAWFASRLTAAGVRPISNVVDVTNYVNLELGSRCTRSISPSSPGPRFASGGRPEANRSPPSTTSSVGWTRTCSSSPIATAPRPSPG